MNKIIRNVPVEQLPKEWRDGLPRDGVIEIELRVQNTREMPAKLSDFIGVGPNIHGSKQDVLEYIASIRADRDAPQ